MSHLSRPEPDREGLNTEKLSHLFRVMIQGVTRKADAHLHRFTDFDADELRHLTGKSIENLLLDVDACLAPPYGPILKENLDHIDDLMREGIRLGVYSNCVAMDRLEPLRERSISIYDGEHAKPSATGFLEVCRKMEFDPRKTWMIDDNPLTGGGAVGVLGGFALVEPIGIDLQYVRLGKLPSLLASAVFRRVAIERTLQGNTTIHRFGRG